MATPCNSPYCRDGISDDEIQGFFGPPPNKWEIGSVAWLCMHTGAANLTDPMGYHFLEWLRAALTLYPCEECKSDFMRILVELPIPAWGTKETLSLWICEFHNRVNQSLGMAVYPCDCRSLLAQFTL
eukprot:Protomagalhaensia_wolfi_Nauph_80__5870@NODE_753_length_2029_cov_101_715075_g566_i0_p2_GENE_NODE_753_length_2029_cov_101_715075_g566_i0NODE_753_length_2029_cov_101_715075_g566_i0_p2_ORF_typecomplete_len127_score5_61Evr1_Alr/PF04777_13/6_5e13_NODE_753_length_2029_cov_101_715075_g566_i071451